MTTLDLRQFSVLSFDCYGTLIDWETGLLRSLSALFAAHGVALPDEAALALYAELEAEIEAGPFVRYRAVLEGVARGFGRRLGFETSDDEARAFAASLGGWPPFADTAEALRALGRRYRLIVLSNVDDDLFAETAKRLGVRFDDVITAEQVGSYKPSPRNFEALVRRAGVPKERILHVAQSLYHDHVPARRMGLHGVWVNRYPERAGGGATRPAEATVDLEVPDLATLAGMVEEQRQNT